MIRKRTVSGLILSVLLLPAGDRAAAEPPPSGKESPGPPNPFSPTLAETGVRRFARNDLYGHINGGAEIFLEFGFEELLVREFSRGEDRITVDVYRMASPEGALGVYLMKAGGESPHPALPVRNSWNRYQVTALKGDCFLLANNFGGDESLLNVAMERLRDALRSIEEAEPSVPFNLLPLENRISGSERLVCGPFSLQSVYTLGEGDILLLDGEVFGAAARYEEGREGAHTLVRIPYPDEESAGLAFRNLARNLDPGYERILPAREGLLLFKDYKGRYGIVRRFGRRLDLKLRLQSIDPELTG